MLENIKPMVKVQNMGNHNFSELFRFFLMKQWGCVKVKLWVIENSFQFSFKFPTSLLHCTFVGLYAKVCL